jgi:hypothetical protein
MKIWFASLTNPKKNGNNNNDNDVVIFIIFSDSTLRCDLARPGYR